MQPERTLKCLAPLAWLAATTVASLWLVRPPAAIPETAPLSDFSSGRAMKHVRAIARQPRPVGSSANAEVREYLVRELAAVGLEVQLHKVESWNVWTNEPVLLENIVARWNGTDGRRAVMLVCHYDSVPSGPGAGDDAAGVAAVLESLRALRQGPPLRNDLIVLITDAEEGGLLGARSFVAEHPWLADVELVLNFEARGNGGPVLLMQAGRENGWLIRQFAQAAPHPFGTSFAEDVFRRMPNDTDFTIFRDSGKTGLNFAFFKGLRYYHSDQDTVANLDERSVQHHGTNCLALARHFGSLSLDETRQPDVVFFNLLGTLFVWYPVGWTVPITVVSLAAFALALFRGFRRRRISLLGLAGGLATQLCTIAAAAGAVAGAWACMRRLPAMNQSISRGDIAGADLASLGFTTLTVAIFAAGQIVAARRLSVENRAAGALVIWAVLAALSCLFVPRGNYLFSWPLLFSSVGLCAVPTEPAKDDLTAGRLLVLCCSSLPGALLLVPSTYLISITIGTSLSWATALCSATFLGLLTPQFELALAAARRMETADLGPYGRGDAEPRSL